ncbi:MAG TPA: hypothetical protein VF142_11200 [Longimicrobium sp.]
MTTERSPGPRPPSAATQPERKALEPVEAAPPPPPSAAADARAGWPAEAHLPDETEDDEC